MGGTLTLRPSRLNPVQARGGQSAWSSVLEEHLWNSEWVDLHFADRETEARGGFLARPGSQSQKMVREGLESQVCLTPQVSWFKKRLKVDFLITQSETGIPLEIKSLH